MFVKLKKGKDENYRYKSAPRAGELLQLDGRIAGTRGLRESWLCRDLHGRRHELLRQHLDRVKNKTEIALALLAH